MKSKSWADNYYKHLYYYIDRDDLYLSPEDTDEDLLAIEKRAVGRTPLSKEAEAILKNWRAEEAEMKYTRLKQKKQGTRKCQAQASAASAQSNLTGAAAFLMPRRYHVRSGTAPIKT